MKYYWCSVGGVIDLLILDLITIILQSDINILYVFVIVSRVRRWREIEEEG